MEEEQAGDAPVTRAEINRLWTNTRVLEHLVAQALSAAWRAADIDRWQTAAVTQLDRAPMEDELMRANLVRAADRLAGIMRRYSRRQG